MKINPPVKAGTRTTSLMVNP